MRDDRRLTRAVVATALVLVAIGLSLGGAVAAAFLWGGVFNVAANEPHWAVTRWALETSLESSVSSASGHIIAPSVGRERVTQESLQTYASECAVCHGAPGRERPDMARNMRPQPPPLAEVALDWTPSERFWIIKNGIKMTGMPAWGPVIADEKIWNLVAVTFALPEMSQQEYTERMQGEAAEDDEAAPEGQEAAEAEAEDGEQRVGTAEPTDEQRITVAEAETEGQPEPRQEEAQAAPQQQAEDQDAEPRQQDAPGTQAVTGPEAEAEEAAAIAEERAAEDGAETAAAGEAGEEVGEAGVAATVGMTGELTFEPRSITISAGETVRWTNSSEVPHTVTADKEKANDPDHVRLPDGAEPFDSGFIGPGGTFEKTFTAPGGYSTSASRTKRRA